MFRQRCAMYTRKSPEEGLEQSFNSLDAQREACAAYILSQKPEVWAEISERYDDGGFSGGTMDRRGLQQLLDVRARRVDVIVVYKVDRLTRVPADFAKMVDVFGEAGASFLSVTQDCMKRVIDDATWKLVQTQLAGHGDKTIRSTRRPAKRLLDGVLFDSKGRAMRTTYASKSIRADGTIRTKRYWHYTSSLSGSEDKSEIERLPADEIERVVLKALNERLADTRRLADQIKGQAREAIVVGILRTIEQRVVEEDITNDDAQSHDFLSIIDRIDAHKGRLVVSLNLAELAEPDATHPPIPAIFEILFQKRQNGCARPIIIADDNAPQQDPDLIALVADARRWASELLEGRASSIHHITEREGLRSGSVSRILPLAWLAPDISTAILEGRQPSNLTAKTLRALPELPLDWAEQRRVLGFAQH